MNLNYFLWINIYLCHSLTTKGICPIKRAQVVALAKFLSIDETELFTLWLADKVLEKKSGLRPLFAVINEQRSCDLFVDYSNYVWSEGRSPDIYIFHYLHDLRLNKKNKS